MQSSHPSADGHSQKHKSERLAAFLPSPKLPASRHHSLRTAALDPRPTASAAAQARPAHPACGHPVHFRSPFAYGRWACPAPCLALLQSQASFLEQPIPIQPPELRPPVHLTGGNGIGGGGRGSGPRAAALLACGCLGNSCMTELYATSTRGRSLEPQGLANFASFKY